MGSTAPDSHDRTASERTDNRMSANVPGVIPDPAADERPSRLLRKPPLIEAILEVRWPFEADPRNLMPDPGLKMMQARFFDRLSNDFTYQPLPLASVPDAVAVGNVQYRWSSVRHRGLLIQLGPGVMTVNHVDGPAYVWDSFKNECRSAVELLESASPVKPFSATAISFRYINAIPFDSAKQDTFEFLRTKLHTPFSPPSDVLPRRIDPKASNLQSQTSFMCSNPRGRISLAFANVYQPEEKFVWQILFDSQGPDVPPFPDGIASWLKDAHGIIDEVFWNMIRGDLESAFS